MTSRDRDSKTVKENVVKSLYVMAELLCQRGTRPLALPNSARAELRQRAPRLTPARYLFRTSVSVFASPSAIVKAVASLLRASS